MTNGRNRTNIIKKIQEGRGSYGRFNKGSHRGIELQNSIYNSGLWWDRSRRRRCRNMDHHDGTGLLSILFVRNLKVENPGKVQLALESVIEWGENFFKDIIGEENKRYIPWLMTVALYLACANLIGLFGFKPPTKELNITAGLAIMSMLLIEYSGIHKNGVKHWCGHFAKPVPLVAPIMILEIFIRPLSLCMRLFGNMLGGFVVMELVEQVVPLFVPIPLSFYFDIFDGLLQAYVFVFLTGLFMNEEME